MRALAAALLASAWLGATVFFTVGVAPGVFAALASPPLAGRVIGRVLPPLFYAGLAIGLVMGILALVFVIAAWRSNGQHSR